VHEQIEEFPRQRLGLVPLYQRFVLGVIPNKKLAQVFFREVPSGVGESY